MNYFHLGQVFPAYATIDSHSKTQRRRLWRKYKAKNSKFVHSPNDELYEFYGLTCFSKTKGAFLGQRLDLSESQVPEFGTLSLMSRMRKRELWWNMRGWFMVKTSNNRLSPNPRFGMSHLDFTCWVG